MANLHSEYDRYVAFHNASHAEVKGELTARTEWARELERNLDERTRWALSLEQENKEAQAGHEQARERRSARRGTPQKHWKRN